MRGRDGQHQGVSNIKGRKFETKLRHMCARTEDRDLHLVLTESCGLITNYQSTN